MNIKGSLRKITELGIGLTAVSILALAGCGGGGGGVAPASVMVSTFAGTSGVYGQIDGTGTAARFMTPTYIASDGTNLYVTDEGNNNIRKIVIATGEVTTLAGAIDGASGVTDATGTIARFNHPWGITTDGTNLYVADSDNYTIRQINIATGLVSTLAGVAGVNGSEDTASGTAATFGETTGIGWIGTNLFVASSSHTIRKIDISTASAVVSTLAGSAALGGYQNGTGASAVFYAPTGLTTDGSSFVYVADTLNHDIRKINAATGETTLVAGGNSTLPQSGVGSTDAIGMSARFNTPFGITTDGTNLYVTDNYNHTVRKIVIDTGFVSTPAGAVLTPGNTNGAGPMARFQNPMGIIFVNGVLYVADYSNGCIRKIQL